MRRGRELDAGCIVGKTNLDRVVGFSGAEVAREGFCKKLTFKLRPKVDGEQ